jgi:hypothetical protein
MPVMSILSAPALRESLFDSSMTGLLQLTTKAQRRPQQPRDCKLQKAHDNRRAPLQRIRPRCHCNRCPLFEKVHIGFWPTAPIV